MKAISTRYHGPGNTRGARISAFDMDGNRVSIGYPHDVHSGEDAHRKAAVALCSKMGWEGPLAGGAVRGGFVFVFIPTAARQVEQVKNFLAARV